MTVSGDLVGLGRNSAGQSSAMELAEALLYWVDLQVQPSNILVNT